MKCNLCDREIASDSNFCPHCGKPVEPSQSDTISPVDPHLCDQCGKELLAYDNTGERAAVLIKLGQISQRNLEYREAIMYFNEAIILQPSLVEAYMARSIVWEKWGDYRKVIDDLDVAVFINPKNHTALRRRGNAYLVLGHYVKAIEDFDLAIKLCWQDSISHSRKGLSYFEIGDYWKAMNSLNQAIHLDPNDPWNYYWRSQIYTVIGQSEESQQDMCRHNSLLRMSAKN